jgi:hypothetical protein
MALKLNSMAVKSVHSGGCRHLFAACIAAEIRKY